MQRTQDISGISGTGYVAEGIQFHDGQVAVSWFGQYNIMEVPGSLDTWLAVHGHEGTTTIVWIDPCESTIGNSPSDSPKNA